LHNYKNHKRIHSFYFQVYFTDEFGNVIGSGSLREKITFNYVGANYIVRIYNSYGTPIIDKTGALVLCQIPQLSYYLKQTNNYRLKLDKSSESSGSFQINRPYLAVAAQDNKYECEDIGYLRLSEKFSESKWI